MMDDGEGGGGGIRGAGSGGGAGQEAPGRLAVEEEDFGRGLPGGGAARCIVARVGGDDEYGKDEGQAPHGSLYCPMGANQIRWTGREAQCRKVFPAWGILQKLWGGPLVRAGRPRPALR